MKVLVHVEYPSGIQTKTKKTQYIGEKEIIVMRKTGTFSKKEGWSFEVPEGSVRPERQWFGLKTIYHVNVKPEAESAIIFKRDLKPDEIPVWDKFQSAKFINRKLLEKRGEEPKEPNANMGLIILAILVIVGIALQVILSGRVQFH